MVWKLIGKECEIYMKFGLVMCRTAVRNCIKRETGPHGEFGPECLKEKEDMKQKAETVKREKQIGERKTIDEGW